MSSETQKILTTDGIPLEESLKKAEKKNRLAKEKRKAKREFLRKFF